MLNSENPVYEWFDALIADFGQETGAAVFKHFIEKLGGIKVHVPSLRTLEIRARNAAVRQAYKDGFTYEQLSNKYHLDERSIRRIIHGDKSAL